MPIEKEPEMNVVWGADDPEEALEKAEKVYEKEILAFKRKQSEDKMMNDALAAALSDDYTPGTTRQSKEFS